MHGWIDSKPSMAGQAIDQRLRWLLGGFRLPGEAQKIDRIMEKFAEVRLWVFFVVVALSVINVAVVLAAAERLPAARGGAED